jgi:hypothetical protein
MEGVTSRYSGLLQTTHSFAIEVYEVCKHPRAFVPAVISTIFLVMRAGLLGVSLVKLWV